jgi:lipopolysaccharide/colanic/teichoic acid biosynthesis glycosyltransferase
VLDWSIAALLILALALPALALALIIKLDSRGPVFLRQTRLGRNGRPFTVVKFRTMVENADDLWKHLRAHNEQAGPLFKMKRDPRMTRVGRLLRKTSIDEFPQLINVLRGEMSLVGPRPPLPREVAEYSEHQLGRLAAKPGMTGLWQVSGRSTLGFDEMVELDLRYISEWSFLTDVMIMARTIPAVLSTRGAY